MKDLFKKEREKIITIPKRRVFTALEVQIFNCANKKFLTGFTLIELLVGIAIIALMMAILLPALSKIRRQAKTVVCRSNLKQWGSIFLIYANDNNGCMPFTSNKWPDALQPHRNNNYDLCYCPMATIPISEGGQHPFAAFEPFSFDPISPGSYGINAWVCNPPPEVKTNPYGLPTTNNWRNVNVRGGNRTPLVLDSMWIDSWPDTANTPPPSESPAGHPYSLFLDGSTQMRVFCINRHDATINSIFLDASVSKIGLKELWKLKWHRGFDINGPWTEAGGVGPDDWPDWMKKFKGY